MRLLKKSNILSYLYQHGLLYQTPINISYWWNFGSLAGLALMLQVVTGIGLTFWYIGSVEMAFASVEFLMREVNNGWLLRYMHSNGASLFFVVVYLHMGRSLFFGSYGYPREKLWISGVIIFLVMIITAFLGYVLPWGQMSYWAATVITSLLSVVPVIGEQLLFFIWGGISIDQPTLTRVYGLHYLLPFVLIGLIILHIILLHEHGSNNPSGMVKTDTVPFHPYFTYKDLLGFIITLWIYFYFVFKLPNVLSHSDNYILADAGVTPTHIVPEWYFLPFYAILRSVPSKAGGVFLLVGAILTLLLLPFFVIPLQKSGFFRPLFKHGFISFVYVWFFLGWSGGNPIETPFYELCQLATGLYFFFFLIFLPGITYLENLLYFSTIKYTSDNIYLEISEKVLDVLYKLKFTTKVRFDHNKQNLRKFSSLSHTEARKKVFKPIVNLLHRINNWFKKKWNPATKIGQFLKRVIYGIDNSDFLFQRDFLLFQEYSNEFYSDLTVKNKFRKVHQLDKNNLVVNDNIEDMIVYIDRLKLTEQKLKKL